MKAKLVAIGLFLLALAACVKVPEPVEGPILTLSQIDTLMWHRPDSALAVMMEFAGSEAADSLDVFEGHYCQVLVAELLFKNDYAQSNREDVLKAVGYFDSIVGMDGADTLDKADARGASLQRDAFLAARAHYINGVGFYERDSVVAACVEYLKALEIMETYFPNLETRHGTSLQPNHIPRFLWLTYSRLAELFSGQFMQEPAIVCCKKALVFNRIEQGSSNNQSCLLLFLGNQYHKLKQYDSAEYYLNEALNQISNTENLVYRDLVSQMALLNYDMGKGIESSISYLKRMASQATSDQEKLVRFLTIGAIYYADKQYDSALAYLIPVFENDESMDGQKIAASEIREIYQYLGDTLKVTPFAMYLAENTVSEGESNAQVSQLNDMFQQHLQWEQERTEAERQQAARLRRNRMIVVVCVLVVVAALLAWLLHRRKMKQQRDEASQQMEAVQKAHRLEKASMSGRLKKSNQELRELKDQMRQQAGNGAPKQEAQAVSFNKEPICRLILERVSAGQFKSKVDYLEYKTYALSKQQLIDLRVAADQHFDKFTIRLKKAYPQLTNGDLDYCCLYLLGLTDADIAALMQRAYNTVVERDGKLKKVFGNENPLPVTLMGVARQSLSI